MSVLRRMKLGLRLGGRLLSGLLKIPTKKEVPDKSWQSLKQKLSPNHKAEAEALIFRNYKAEAKALPLKKRQSWKWSQSMDFLKPWSWSQIRSFTPKSSQLLLREAESESASYLCLDKWWSQNRVKIFYLYNVKITPLTRSPSIFTDAFSPTTSYEHLDQEILHLNEWEDHLYPHALKVVWENCLTHLRSIASVLMSFSRHFHWNLRDWSLFMTWGDRFQQIFTGIYFAAPHRTVES